MLAVMNRYTLNIFLGKYLMVMVCKGKDTLWNISFRLFHETWNCLMYISLHLIWFHDILIKYEKKEASSNYDKKNEYKRESSV